MNPTQRIKVKVKIPKQQQQCINANSWLKKNYFLIVSGKAKNMGENQPKTFQKNCFFQPLYSLAAFGPDPRRKGAFDLF